MRRLITTLGLILICGEMTAAQYIPMDPTIVIPVTLSSTNHNRIGIIGDRIKKAFFRNGNISVDVEEDSGQIFIQSMRTNCPNTTISVVSTSGQVQELELHFAGISSEIVLLQPVDFLPAAQNECYGNCCNVVEEQSLTALVNGFVKGVIPEGYLSIEDQEQARMIGKGLRIQRLSRLVNQRQIVFVYRVENASCKTKKITECKVNILDGDWVFLDRYELRPRECALVLIGCMR